MTRYMMAKYYNLNKLKNRSEEHEMSLKKIDILFGLIFQAVLSATAIFLSLVFTLIYFTWTFQVIYFTFNSFYLPLL